MKHIKFLLICTTAFSTKLIQHGNLPVCRNCLHYQPPEYGPFSSVSGTCKLFGDKDVVTGDIEYKYARICRRDESLCGNHGALFKEEPNLQWKMGSYYACKNQLLILLYFTFTVYLIILVSNILKNPY